MNAFIPAWIIGGPFVGLLILSFSFKGPSTMGGSLPRIAPQDGFDSLTPSGPVSDALYPGAPRRKV